MTDTSNTNSGSDKEGKQQQSIPVEVKEMMRQQEEEITNTYRTGMTAFKQEMMEKMKQMISDSEKAMSKRINKEKEVLNKASSVGSTSRRSKPKQKTILQPDDTIVDFPVYTPRMAAPLQPQETAFAQRNQSKGRKSVVAKPSIITTEPLGKTKLPPLTISLSAIVDTMKGQELFEKPPAIRIPPKLRSSTKYCSYHEQQGHDTEQCFTLKKLIRKWYQEGQLPQYMISNKGKGTEEATTSKIVFAQKNQDQKRKRGETKSIGIAGKSSKELELPPLAMSLSALVGVMKAKSLYEKPSTLRAPYTRSNKSEYCLFHEQLGHDTERCYKLRELVNKLYKEGRLPAYVIDNKEKGIAEASTSRIKDKIRK